MMSRTPLIAGNWKMHKTVAEAEEFIQALLPRVSPPTASTSRSARRSPTCRPWSTPRAARAWRSSRRTCTRRREGAFTGEISAPMLTELDVHGVVLGHSERRQFFSETDRALAQKVAGRARGRPAADPLRRRDRGRARDAATPSASCATRSRRASRSSRATSLGDVVDRLRADLGDRHRAGRDARAGPGRDRLRPRAGRRPRPRAGRAHADPLRRLREARQRGRAARAARRRRRARRRRVARGRSFAAIIERGRGAP